MLIYSVTQGHLAKYQLFSIYSILARHSVGGGGLVERTCIVSAYMCIWSILGEGEIPTNFFFLGGRGKL
jgi:hypothetical protein